MPEVPRFDMGGIGLQPITDDWGFSRGHPVDRHYIESFLMRHAGDIRGAVLEVGDRGYTQRFGAGRVTTSDILDVDADNAAATYVADLRDATSVPSDTFDCFILTQVLVLIRETPEALREVFRILKPGGVALITVPGSPRLVPSAPKPMFGAGPTIRRRYAGCSPMPISNPIR